MIAVFGSINADLVARVHHLPRDGETQAATAYACFAGGKGANQALAARRAGAEVVLYGAIGRDGFAVTALADLETSGIELGTVTRTGEPTGIALIHVDASGQNTITIVAGANALARADSIPDAALTPATTLLLQLEVPLPEIVALAARARLRGVRMILNAAPAHPLPAALIAAIDVLIVNEHEAEAVAAQHRSASRAESVRAGRVRTIRTDRRGDARGRGRDRRARHRIACRPGAGGGGRRHDGGRRRVHRRLRRRIRSSAAAAARAGARCRRRRTGLHPRRGASVAAWRHSDHRARPAVELAITSFPE